MKLACWAIIVVAALGAVAKAITIPSGHELLKQEGNYYTIRNNTTQQIDTYYIEGEPITSGWQTEMLDDSVIFRQVYYLDAFMTRDIFVFDFNSNGLPEFFSAIVRGGLRPTFLENQGDFNFMEIYRLDRPMTIWGFGDTDNDGLFEILGQDYDSLILIEQGQSDGFPNNQIWYNTAYVEQHVTYARIGDIDGDGIKDITFLCSLYDPWRIAFFENSGDNQFVQRNPIVWQSGGPADYSYSDFDNDGKNEIISALAPTGIMMYEYITSDSFAPIWQTDLGCPNPYLHESIGDNNGNGYGEWVSCGRDFSRSGFFFKVFEATGDNQYQVVYYDSLPGDCWEDGGLANGDIDNDGRNEFMVSANSNIGLYKYDSITGWHLAWLLEGGGPYTTYPNLLDVDNDSECEIVISGGLLRVRVYDRIHSGVDQSQQYIAESDGVEIYPNPTNNSLKIEINDFQGNEYPKIYDINGRLVKGIIPISGKHYIWNLCDNNGKEVSSGIYFISVGNGEQRFVKRALILR